MLFLKIWKSPCGELLWQRPNSLWQNRLNRNTAFFLLFLLTSLRVVYSSEDAWTIRTVPALFIKPMGAGDLSGMTFLEFYIVAYISCILLVSCVLFRSICRFVNSVCVTVEGLDAYAHVVYSNVYCLRRLFSDQLILMKLYKPERRIKNAERY